MSHLPILVWRDAAGVFGAAPATSAKEAGEPDGLVALGADEASAVDGLVRLLGAARRERAQWSPRELDRAHLKLVPVRVRPVYAEGGRSYPGRQEVDIQVVCVHGETGDGLRLAVLPFLGIELRFHEGQSLPLLVEHAARERLQGRSPEELAGLVPPVWLALRHLALPRERAAAAGADPVAPPTLSLVADPVGPETRRGARAWEREDVVASLMEAIAGRRASVLVVGEAGCGKSLVVNEALSRLQREARAGAPRVRPHAWQGRSAWLTGAGRILSDMRYLGDWQARCEKLVAELGEIDGLLVFDDLLEILRGSQPIGGFLMPYVTRRQLQIVAECTPAELVACRRLDPGLLDELQIVALESCDHERSLAILQRAAEAERRGLGAEIDAALPAALLELCERFAPHRTLPGLPVELLRQLCEETRARTGATASGASVSSAEAIDMFVRRSGLPRRFLLDEIPLTEDEIVEDLQRHVLGQEQACRAAAGVVLRFKAGLSDPERPLGALLLCGPTGVGKTALARALARTLFGEAEEQRLVRADMSEYATALSAARLLGGAGGEPGELVKGIRAQPFSVVLLDEVDKAAPEVLQALLGVLDTGRATDALGRVTSFQSAIFVLTANLGVAATEPLGFGQPAPAPLLAAEVEDQLGAEFAGAIDACVQFRSLDPDTARAIVCKELDEIASREGLRDLGLRLRCTDAMLAHLVHAGFDRRYGARPLQRTLEREVVAPVARHLIRHPHLEDVTLTLDHDDVSGTSIRWLQG